MKLSGDDTVIFTKFPLDSALIRAKGASFSKSIPLCPGFIRIFLFGFELVLQAALGGPVEYE